MVIVEIAVLRNVARHPIPRPLEHKKIEDAVVDRGATLGLLAQIEIAESLCKLGNQCGLRRVVLEPSFEVKEVASARGFDRS